jgi:hypothetical protein
MVLSLKILALLALLALLTLLTIVSRTHDITEPVVPSDTVLTGRRVAWYFIVRDGAEYLERNVTRLVDFSRRHALDYHFFFVENDSSDGTQAILERVMSSNATRVTGIFLRVATTHSTEMCTGRLLHNCSNRTRFLARMREQALQLGRNAQNTSELTCMLDLDFVDFDDHQLAYMMRFLLAHPERDAIFGMSEKTTTGRPYDTGSITGWRAWSQVIALSVASYRPKIVNVTSAFSGFGVYKTQAVRGKHYDLHHSQCEHIAFNKQLKHLAVYTGFKPTY